jgi:sulfur-oxidizing protein SoxZ
MPRALINVPRRPLRPGEPFEIKLLIQHPMENGFRRDATGQAVPRDILHRFTCTYGGEVVIDIDLHPAIAANPFLSFFAVAGESGVLEMRWVDDNGETTAEHAPIVVA